MGATERPADRGKRLGRRLARELGEQHRLARVTAGLSQAEVGRAAGLSRAAVGRIERGQSDPVGLVDLAVLLAVVGLDLSARAYPGGQSHRDAAHAAFLGRFLARIPEAVERRLEVPLPNAGDRRSWDALVRPEGLRVGVEAEMRPRDGQELKRRLALKRRDGGVDRLVLVLPDTRSNRTFLREVGGDWAADFPVPGREALRDLDAGRAPTGDAIILLPGVRRQRAGA